MTTILIASTWDEAVSGALLPGAVIVGGGTSVQPWLTRSGAEPSTLVHLGNVAGARTIEPVRAGDGAPRRVRIGAGVTVADRRLHRLFGGSEPAWFATPSVRRRATVVGNVVSGHGPRELVPVLAACAARIVLQSPTGARLLDITRVPPSGTGQGEVARAVEICLPDRTSYQRIALRPRVSRAEVAVAAALGHGCGASLTIGAGGRALVVDGAQDLLADPRSADAFAAAARRTCLAESITAAELLRLVGGLAERAHRDLHAPSREDRP